MMIEWARDPSPEWMDHDQDFIIKQEPKGKRFFLEREHFKNFCIRTN